MFRLVPWLVLFVACAPPERSRDDVDDTPNLDAGTEPVDAGEVDAGEVDAGEVDAGEVDAGAPELDGGEEFDGGTSAVTRACNAIASSASDPEAHAKLLVCLDGNSTAAQKAKAIGVFASTVEGRGGFPIADGAQVVFVWTGSGAIPSVAGDFNAWQPAPLERHASGFASLKVPVATSARAGSKYKLVAASTWFADPLARRFQYDEFGEFSLVAPATGASHLERIANVHATDLDVDRPIWVYVPRGYSTGTAAYPVVYMHDGQNLFDVGQGGAFGTWDADGVADLEIAAGHVRPFLIVGIPNNDNRFGEYTVGTDVLDGDRVGGDGEAYGDFLVHDLKPVIDARYRTSHARADTAILGSSLGGLISYELGLIYPDVFGPIGGLSSTFQWGTIGQVSETVIDRYRASTALVPGEHVFYLDSGGGSPGCPGGDQEEEDNYCTTLEMKDVLVAKGFDTFPDDPSADLITPADANIAHWWEPGAPHSEEAWNARLFRAFRLFFHP